MNNKMIWGLVGLLVVGILAFAGISYAYRGNSNIQSPNYDADVHEALEEAMANNDYDAWLKIRQDNNLPMKGKIFSVINEDNFDRYVEMHNAMLEGDTETADLIRAELGLGSGTCGMHKEGGCKMQGSQGYGMTRATVSGDTTSTTISPHSGCPRAKSGTCSGTCSMH
jgi:hypothetical protein